MYKLPIRYGAIITILALLSTLPAPAGAAARKGEVLPALQATSVTGQKVSTGSYTGKVLLLAVSANFCSMCTKGVPRLEKMQQLYGERGLQVQGVIYGPGLDLEELRQYIARNRITYPLALTDSTSVRNVIGITLVPLYLLLDRKGCVVGIYRGFSERNMLQIEKEVGRLLAE